MHDTPAPRHTRICARSLSARHSVSLPCSPAPPSPPSLLLQIRGWTHHSPRPHRTALRSPPTQAWKEKEVIWSHSPDHPHPAREAEGIQHSQIQTPARRHIQTGCRRSDSQTQPGPQNRRQVVLAGPNRARSSHARTCTRTHTIEHATASGQAEMPRAGPCPVDLVHKDAQTCAAP